MKHYLPDPKSISYDDMIEVIRSIQRALWVRYKEQQYGDARYEEVVDPDAEWSADTTDLIAGILHDAGLGITEAASAKS